MNTPAISSNHPKAFTLIELLVVIVIIAILAFIAVPTFNKMVESNKVAQDAHYLRLIGSGTVAYLNDHNDFIFDVTTTAEDAHGNTLRGPGLLTVKYIQDVRTFHSPFDKRADKSTGAPIMSYGVNENIMTWPAHPKQYEYDGNWTNLSAASQLVYMAPNIDVSNANDVVFLPEDASTAVALKVPIPATSRDSYRGTHKNRSQINVLYADCHVASVYYKYFTAQTTDDDKKGWQPFYP